MYASRSYGTSIIKSPDTMKIEHDKVLMEQKSYHGPEAEMGYLITALLIK